MRVEGRVRWVSCRCANFVGEGWDRDGGKGGGKGHRNTVRWRKRWEEGEGKSLEEVTRETEQL